MKHILTFSGICNCILYSLLIGFFFLPVPIVAEDLLPSETDSRIYRENKDGEIKEGEYEVLNPNGSLTRRPCPYHCKNRGIPKENCREWKSKDEKLCYVHDARLPQNAVPLASQ